MKSQRVAALNTRTGTSLSFFSPKNPFVSLLSSTVTLVSQFSSVDASLVINNGIPNGANDLCSSQSYCSQSYITDNEQLVSQVFASIVKSTSSASLGALWQLLDCLTIDKVDTALLSALLKSSASTTNTTANCASSSLQFFGYQATSIATNLTAEQCFQFQSNYQTIATECLDSSRAHGLSAAVAFIMIGLLLLIPFVIFIACMCQDLCTKGQAHHHSTIGTEMRNSQRLVA